MVWLGRIDPLKDLETLIRAVALVHREMPKVRFVLYGKAPKGNEWYDDRCVKLRDELGLKETVIFAGFAASAEAAYNESDFAVLSSISEGFPYSVVEAMLCGRTVVGTDVGGVSEALDGCGLVVEPRNPAQMAEACLRLLRDPALRQEYGRKARQKALDQFSLQQCNSAYLASYQSLATEALSRRRLAPAPAAEPASRLRPASVESALGRCFSKGRWLMSMSMGPVAVLDQPATTYGRPGSPGDGSAASLCLPCQPAPGRGAVGVGWRDPGRRPGTVSAPGRICPGRRGRKADAEHGERASGCATSRRPAA